MQKIASSSHYGINLRSKNKYTYLGLAHLKKYPYFNSFLQVLISFPSFLQAFDNLELPLTYKGASTSMRSAICLRKLFNNMYKASSIFLSAKDVAALMYNAVPKSSETRSEILFTEFFKSFVEQMKEVWKDIKGTSEEIVSLFEGEVKLSETDTDNTTATQPINPIEMNLKKRTFTEFLQNHWLKPESNNKNSTEKSQQNTVSLSPQYLVFSFEYLQQQESSTSLKFPLSFYFQECFYSLLNPRYTLHAMMVKQKGNKNPFCAYVKREQEWVFFKDEIFRPINLGVALSEILHTVAEGESEIVLFYEKETTTEDNEYFSSSEISSTPLASNSGGKETRTRLPSLEIYDSESEKTPPSRKKIFRNESFERQNSQIIQFPFSSLANENPSLKLPSKTHRKNYMFFSKTKTHDLLAQKKTSSSSLKKKTSKLSSRNRTPSAPSRDFSRSSPLRSPTPSPPPRNSTPSSPARATIPTRLSRSPTPVLIVEADSSSNESTPPRMGYQKVRVALSSDEDSQSNNEESTKALSQTSFIQSSVTAASLLRSVIIKEEPNDFLFNELELTFGRVLEAEKEFLAIKPNSTPSIVAFPQFLRDSYDETGYREILRISLSSMFLSQTSMLHGRGSLAEALNERDFKNCFIQFQQRHDFHVNFERLNEDLLILKRYQKAALSVYVSHHISKRANNKSELYLKTLLWAANRADPLNTFEKKFLANGVVNALTLTLSLTQSKSENEKKFSFCSLSFAFLKVVNQKYKLNSPAEKTLQMACASVLNNVALPHPLEDDELLKLITVDSEFSQIREIIRYIRDLKIDQAFRNETELQNQLLLAERRYNKAVYSLSDSGV